MYDHFCAGENKSEVTATIRRIKSMGFKGVILTYAREVVVDLSTGVEQGKGVQQVKEDSNVPTRKVAETIIDEDIKAWREGVLETVGMVGEGDYLALKQVYDPNPSTGS